METNKHLMIMYKWYNRIDVKFEIIKHTLLRESSFLVPSYRPKEEKIFNTRMLKIHSIQHFDFWFKCLHIYDKQKVMNFYYTLAKYKNGIPNQSGNLKDRTKEDKIFWNVNHHKYMESYDLLIDIDADSKDEVLYAYDSAKMIKLYFDSLKVPHEIRYSGRGFHFIISYKYFDNTISLNPNDENNIYRIYAMISNKLKDNFSEMVDTSLYDSRRLCKVPYSLAHYNDGIYICMPILTEKEFLSFELEKYNINNFKGDVSKRGTRIFNESGNVEFLLRDLRISQNTHQEHV